MSKIVVITGAGVGRAIATESARSGRDVALPPRRVLGGRVAGAFAGGTWLGKRLRDTA